jgi:hypothetical protein
MEISSGLLVIGGGVLIAIMGAVLIWALMNNSRR